jgi:hypothetical protein
VTEIPHTFESLADSRAKMESIQEKMLLCNISPTVSPKRRAKSTQRDMFEIGSSYMSQDQNMSPTQNYHMVRTLSSPSIIDASPKKTMHEVMDVSTTISPTSVQTGSFSPRVESKSSNLQTSNKHDLTPVASNVARSLFVENNAQVSEKQANRTFSDCQRPPKAKSSDDSTKRMLSVRPLSPPTFYRDSSTDAYKYLSPRSASPASERCESPLAFTIPIDRNCHSLLTAEYNLRAAFASSPYKSPQRAAPYQPSRDDDLAHFGVQEESADSIFLAPRGVLCDESMDQSDSFDETETSIPSIHLAHRLSTQESYSTRDSSFSMEEGDEVNQEMTITEDQEVIIESKFRSSSCPQPVRPSNSVHKSRMLTPEKERQVYEWLHSLEVEKDNNDFVAEAASSKFLTGKNDRDGYLMENPSTGIFKTTFHQMELKPSAVSPPDSSPFVKPAPTTQTRGRSMDNLHGMYSYTGMGISSGTTRKRPKKTFSLRSSVAL